MPKYLWKLHGRKASVADLALTYLAATVVMAVTCALAVTSMPVWKLAILALVSADIGGGVISNFTRGTGAYYRELGTPAWQFIWLHLLQVSLLCLLFPEQVTMMLIVASFILGFATVVSRILDLYYKRIVAIFLFVVVSLVVTALQGLPVTAPILLNLLALKLVVAFPVKWN